MNHLRVRLGGLLLAIGLLTVRIQAEDKKYSLQDLQALEKSKSWDELMGHLMDVSPSQRTAGWNRVVESACTRLVSMDGYLAGYCLEPLKAVMANEPQNTGFAWKAGKWARLNMRHSAAVPFFANAGLNTGDARCKDEDVSLAVVSGLGLPGDSEKEIVQQSQDLAFQKCWPAVAGALKAELKENSYFSENACPGLKKKGGLSGADVKKCTKGD